MTPAVSPARMIRPVTPSAHGSPRATDPYDAARTDDPA
jgi:hypothetical protein